MSYYAQGKANQPITVTSSVKAGQVLSLDNFIASQMPQAGTNTAGSLVVSTPSSSSLVVTGRTYTDTGKGTYGQFIPAVTPADSVGFNDRTLQLLQLEQSSRMRTNIPAESMVFGFSTVAQTRKVPVPVFVSPPTT